MSTQNVELPAPTKITLEEACRGIPNSPAIGTIYTLTDISAAIRNIRERHDRRVRQIAEGR